MSIFGKGSPSIDYIDKPFKINNFTFYVTEECNFACSYCYQKRRKRRLKISSVQKTIDFFTPYFTDNIDISFYGGEPLLAFEVIELTLRYLEETLQPARSLLYSLTTNGSLLTKDILSVLDDSLWGCFLLFDYAGFKGDESLARTYSFGSIEDFKKEYKVIY
ncbi:MAG: 4Fe-4S cluster-binding domain-containing protein, partial [Candidatus Aminicenantes bacterium]|nr:4Fe-4S cluster-binding domain-containing protein [Candidatus Aminicenantes bacterium]